MDTEISLLNWRNGQIKAERLCASLLNIDGFSSIDPQSTLGGPDGLKDIICEKNRWKYIGATYFPPTTQNFKSIRDKFLHDLVGVSKNNADGIIFLTNQRLTPTERDELLIQARNQDAKAIIYHLERIRVLLDSPIGFGIRLEYLGIPMTQEEQLSFFSNLNSTLSSALLEHAANIKELSDRIERIENPLFERLDKLNDAFISTRATIEDIKAAETFKAHETKRAPGIVPATQTLNIDVLNFLHKAILIDTPYRKTAGDLRQHQVWIGPKGSTPETATFVPPSSDEIPDLIETLLKDWRDSYDAVLKANPRDKIHAIASFHNRFMSVHPYYDGNGRLAKLLISQQVYELFGINRDVIIEETQPYIEAIQKAHIGDLEPLMAVLTQAVFGTEEILG